MKNISIMFLFFVGLIISAADLSLGIDAPQIDKSATRERQCLNGLWRFCPVAGSCMAKTPPPAGSGWGYFKVPGVWPASDGKTHSIQPMLPEEVMKPASNWHSAWYRRTVTTPIEAAGKKVILEIELIQCRATVYLDGKQAGEIVFPGGSLDVTNFVTPGKPQTLELFVNAIPQAQDQYVVMDGNNVFKVAAKVKNKGITGDVFLHIVPDLRLEAPQIITSTRTGIIAIECDVINFPSSKQAEVTATITDPAGKVAKEFSRVFKTDDLKNGRIRLESPWSDAKKWDVNTPQNLYYATLMLKCDGKVADTTLPERFGFREFYNNGKDYMLNGSVIHLRAYHLPNYSAEWMPDKASKAVSLEAFKRLRELGFNFSISRNYDFNEGAVNYLRGHCEAADEFGHLHSFSLPHPWQFGGDLADAANLEGYTKMANYLIRKHWNHPSLILWVTNHNYGGAWGDQNPLRIGGEYKRANVAKEVKSKEKGRNNFLLAQKRITAIDTTRLVYSHASGSLGGQYSLNAYFNWAPLQERSDWLENFSQNGKYPLSIVEWGLPHIASFSSYRGPDFIWNCKDVMTIWDAEYIAAEYGDSVANWSELRLNILDKIIQIGNQPIRWGTLAAPGGRLPDVKKIQADYYKDNLRCMRVFDVGILLPWDDDANYDVVPGNYPAKENPDRWKRLNAPGLVPDYFNWGDYILTAHREQYRLSPLGEVIKCWNQPLIGFIGGERSFTEKEHNYRPGAIVKKQLVMLNDKRESTKCSFSFWLKGVNARPEYGEVEIVPSGKVIYPVSLQLPAKLAPGRYELAAKFNFGNLTFNDSFMLDVLSGDNAPEFTVPIALYDPKGMTAKWLDSLKIRYRKITTPSDSRTDELLVIGREALFDSGEQLNLDAVREGKKVLIFEQQANQLVRLGFRINEHGLRTIFPVSPRHPVLAGLTPENLKNWHGEATLLSSYINYDQFFCPSWKWCGFENTRVWRCRNRGTVANVLVEKPTIGNFTPILDGGFALQYTPGI